MRILFVSAEFSPLCQTGGLGDAVSGLARALAQRGHDVIVAIPGYREVFRSEKFTLWPEESFSVEVPCADGFLFGTWKSREMFPGVRVMALDLPSLYDREGIYGDAQGLFADNLFRFIAFCQAASHWALVNPVDAVVAHDHHAAMTLCYLHARGGVGDDRPARIQVVHNNAYQGRYPASGFALTNLPPAYFSPSHLEAYGSLCLLKGGLMWADHIATVSPTYAQEVQLPGCGEGLEGIYIEKQGILTGIQNGIDTLRFDPATDSALPVPFSQDAPEGKSPCRHAVMAEMGLEPTAAGNFCVAIGRLAFQKGWDVLMEAIPELVRNGFVLALLGDGDPAMAGALEIIAGKFPGRVAFYKGYHDGLARRLYAGADAVLVPSRFEPCGLVQLIAQRYGALPIASAVGGLCDTIYDPKFHHAEKEAPLAEATGILFAPLTPGDLCEAANRLRAIPHEAAWRAMQRSLMGIDVSWEKSAALWEEMLEKACLHHQAERDR